MNYKWILFIWFVGIVTAEYPDCNYYQNISANQTAYIIYPGNTKAYSGERRCTYIVDCPPGHNCRLDCPEIQLPVSSMCMLDQLLVSKTGDTQLKGANVYCGRGSLSVTSEGQRISVGLVTNPYTVGDKYINCTVKAQPVKPVVSCKCGVRRQNRIVGGAPTGVNEFPMMVGLVRASGEPAREDDIRCGGVIISDQYVLTAAHCLVGEQVNNTRVIVGEHYIYISDSPARKVYEVAGFIIHPQFRESNYDYDIALIKVLNKIEFNDRVGPVCLPFKYQNEDFTGKKVTVLGWGSTDFGERKSEVLLKADLEVKSQTMCMFMSYPRLTYRQMCTYTAGKDACQFDSGGPLLYTDSATGLLFSVGIVSFGIGCATDVPGVNTRVTTLLNWIISNTGEEYCVK